MTIQIFTTHWMGLYLYIMRKFMSGSCALFLTLISINGVSAVASNQADIFKSQGWIDIKNSNQKWTGISQHFRSESRPDYLDYDFNIECTWKKQLEISLAAYPNGVKPISNSEGTGFAQIKIDSGKFAKFAYVNMGEMSIKFAKSTAGSSDALMSVVLKGKQQIVIKAPTATSSNSSFTIKLGNLKTYSNKFKSAGCPLS
jgi:hypothetical protein